MTNLKSALLGGNAPIRFAGKAPVIQQPTAAQPKRIKVIVAIPSGRTWEARTATCVTGLVSWTVMQGIDMGVVNLEGSMITKQRNDLVLTAQKHNADYIMFIDSDLMFPHDAIVRLLKHQKDIVGATYNKRVPPYETLGRLRGDRSQAEATGFSEAELLPGGMMLIKMSVFDKLKWPWFFETYQWPGANGVEAWKEMMRNSYGATPPEDVLNVIDNTPLAQWLNQICEIETKSCGQDGKWNYVSEDLNFCRKAIKNGLQLFCDLNLTYELVHLGTMEVTCRKEQPKTAAA